jgi:hypothetical protein
VKDPASREILEELPRVRSDWDGARGSHLTNRTMTTIGLHTMSVIAQFDAARHRSSSPPHAGKLGNGSDQLS